MKKFKDLLSEQIATDYKGKKDDEKEVKGYKPRSKGEEDFANMHTVDKVVHPVAEPEQHTGDRKGPKSDTGEEFDGPEKKCQELPMTYSQFMKLGGWGQSSPLRTSEPPNRHGRLLHDQLSGASGEGCA